MVPTVTIKHDVATEPETPSRGARQIRRRSHMGLLRIFGHGHTRFAVDFSVDRLVSMSSAGICPTQMVTPFYVRNAVAEIVGHL